MGLVGMLTKSIWLALTPLFLLQDVYNLKPLLHGDLLLRRATMPPGLYVIKAPRLLVAV